MTDQTEAVRPTKHCLTQIGCAVPDLGVRLSSLDHPLVAKAQQLPELASKRGAERIRSLTDRVWLKVKTSHWRGAAANLQDELTDEVLEFGAHWWLGAGGLRQADSSQSDFYARIAADAFRGGPHSCSTDFLLPSAWDVKRLVAEGAVNAQRILEVLVRQAAAESLFHSDVRGFVVGDRDVRVRIRVHDDGQAYVAMSVAGSLDHKFFVALLSAVPGTSADDWLPKPDGGLGIEPERGEVIWSVMLSPEIQTMLADGMG